MLVEVDLTVLLVFDIQTHILLCFAPCLMTGYLVLPLSPSVLADKKPHRQTAGQKLSLLLYYTLYIHYNTDFFLMMCG